MSSSRPPSISTNPTTIACSSIGSAAIHKYKIDIALGDLNEDGALDIVTGHHDGLFVLISNGSGGFAGRTLTPPASTQHPACNSVVIADIDADGHLDIVGG